MRTAELPCQPDGRSLEGFECAARHRGMLWPAPHHRDQTDIHFLQLVNVLGRGFVRDVHFCVGKDLYEVRQVVCPSDRWEGSSLSCHVRQVTPLAYDHEVGVLQADRVTSEKRHHGGWSRHSRYPATSAGLAFITPATRGSSALSRFFRFLCVWRGSAGNGFARSQLQQANGLNRWASCGHPPMKMIC
jgi:hypothetical protein